MVQGQTSVVQPAVVTLSGVRAGVVRGSIVPAGVVLHVVVRLLVVALLAAGSFVALVPAADAKGLETGGRGTTYYLANSLAPEADISITYGRATDAAYVGDWNGDGRHTLGVRRGATYYLSNSTTGGAADTVVTYGRADDVTLVGDWDGDGDETLAVRRGATYYLTNSLTGGSADRVLTYGRADDVVHVGDWDGDGDDTLAVRRGATYYLTNSLSSGTADRVLTYGRADDETLVGDWDGDDDDTLAARRGTTYYLTNSLTGGTADRSVTFGRATDAALVGDWDGDGDATLGVRRGFHWSVSGIDAALAARMSTSWRPGCPVPLSDLRYLTMTHQGFDGQDHRGEMVVSARVAGDVVEVFETLYVAGFPIRSMRLVDDFGGDDDASMAADNTSAFNCRAVTGGTSFSQHSYGEAIDVNPVENPYVLGDTVLPPSGRAYLSRPDLPGVIHGGDVVVRAFESIGWSWGGYWRSPIDYQHFSLSGR
jgi:hypothetical protein